MTTAASQPNDFQNLANLLSVFSEASTQMTALQAEIDQQQLDAVDEHKARYAELQKALTDSEGAIKALGTAHPEWFEQAKSVKTPFGELATRSATKHEAPDPDLSMGKILHWIELAEKRGNMAEVALLNSFIRVERSLDLEALEKADADLLARLSIVRVTDTSYTVKAASVKLGQAVKAADKRAAKAEKKGSEVKA